MIALVKQNGAGKMGEQLFRDFSEEFIGWQDPSKLTKTDKALAQAEAPGCQATPILAHGEAPGQHVVQDTVPEGPAQEDRVPADTIPVTVPEDTALEDTLPEDTLPADTLPADTRSEDTLLEDTPPEDKLPEDTLPEDTVQDDTAQEDTVQEYTVPENRKNL
jgi:hypothetical protein